MKHASTCTRRAPSQAMRALLFLGLGILLFPACANCQESTEEARPPTPLVGPRLHIPAPSYDWGKVIEGVVIEHPFVIENTGSELLKIERALPG